MRPIFYVENKLPPMNKAQKNMIIKACKKLDQAAERAVDLTYSCLAIALNRHYGYGKQRIKKIMEESWKAWEEVGQDETMSMIELLDTETGVEVMTEDRKHWYDMPYLNNEAWDGQIRSWQYLYQVRIEQAKWMEATATAGLLLAMHRKEKFGPERIGKLYEHMLEVRNEFEGNTKLLMAAVYDEVKLNLVKRNGGLYFELEGSDKQYLT